MTTDLDLRLEAELERTITYLRGRGSPLVCPARDGVLVCKNGLHAFGPTLVEALDALDRKHAETLATRLMKIRDAAT